MEHDDDLSRPIPLRTGDDGPHRAAREWASLAIAERLAAWRPAVVASLASGLGVDGSDLDVVVDLRFPGFLAAVRAAYGDRPGFSIREHGPRLVVRFSGPALVVEIVGEARPVEEQQAHRHAVVHRRLVLERGATFAAEVRRVRRATGLKTEPAIAFVLGLPGDDAYAAVDALHPERLSAQAVSGARSTGETLPDSTR